MSKPEEIYRPVVNEDESQLLRTCMACLGSYYIKRIWKEFDLQNQLLRMTTNFKGLAPIVQLIKQQMYISEGGPLHPWKNRGDTPNVQKTFTPQ